MRWLILFFLLGGCLSTPIHDSELALVLPAPVPAALAVGQDIVWQTPAGQSAAVLLRFDDQYWANHTGTTTDVNIHAGTALVGLRTLETGLTRWLAVGHGIDARIQWSAKSGVHEMLVLAEGSEDATMARLRLDDSQNRGVALEAEPVWLGGPAAGGAASRGWFGRTSFWLGGGDIAASDQYLTVPCRPEVCVTPRRTTTVHGVGGLSEPGIFSYDMHAVELTGAEAWRLEVTAGDDQYTWAGPGWTALTGDAPAPLAGPAGGFAVPMEAGPAAFSLVREYAGVAHTDPLGADAPLFLVTWAAFPFDPEVIGWTDWQETPTLGPLLVPTT